jgi:hypothetical protein
MKSTTSWLFSALKESKGSLSRAFVFLRTNSDDAEARAALGVLRHKLSRKPDAVRWSLVRAAVVLE